MVKSLNEGAEQIRRLLNKTFKEGGAFISNSLVMFLCSEPSATVLPNHRHSGGLSPMKSPLNLKAAELFSNIDFLLT